MNSINICVCTFDRNELLEKCLLSLYAMDIPTDTQVSVTIVDNHHQQLARELIEKLAADSNLPTHYVHEAKRGIPHARNQALSKSLSLQADYIAFIDDDERVAKDWLCQLYHYCISNGGDIVVSGSVIAEVPANTPADITPLLIKSKARLTGTSLSSCATNNVIFPTTIIQEFNVHFDASNPQAGGEDTVFFTKITGHGIIIKKCAEAIVYEFIPPSRANLTWLIKRKFWAGSINAWRKNQLGRSKLTIFISSLAQFFAYSVLGILLTVSGSSLKRNKALLKAGRSAGELGGLFGLRIDSY